MHKDDYIDKWRMMLPPKNVHYYNETEFFLKNIVAPEFEILHKKIEKLEEEVNKLKDISSSEF